MSLTNCSNCKFYDYDPNHSTDIRCSLQPAYAVMYDRLKDLDSYTLDCLPLDNCRDFEIDPNSATSTSRSIGDWIDVDSEFIEAICYRHLVSVLLVRFHSGCIYQYDFVFQPVFDDFLSAESKGRYFNQYIKDCYPSYFMSNSIV